MTPPSESTFDVVESLLGRWRTIALCAAIGAAAGVVYGLLAPKWYEARLSVVPSQRSQDSAAMALASKLPIGLDTMNTDVQRIQAVLNSTSVTDKIIDKFMLEHRYDVPHRDAARNELWKHCGTSVDRKSGVVSLICEDQDPKVAMEMAAYFGEVGNRVFGRVSASSAREERKFLEAQVAKARKDVETSSRKLRDFQKKHKVVDLPEQSKAVISAMASIKGELLSKQLELSYLSSFSARTEASVVQLQQQIAIMETKLQQLEDSKRAAPQTAPATPSAGSDSTAKPADFFPDAMNVPELRFELEDLLREQKVQETVFFLMTQRYEMAKVDEARDTSTFQILDYPTPPTFHSRPKPLKLAAAGLLAALASSMGLVLLSGWRRRFRPNR